MDKKEFFEVKDDEEQRAKLQDICDLLLAAGYFRVRLKGLSAFDKVVGGIVWCLELCTVDVDVNFLFRENLNIGEKIEITEKIIQVLLSMKCPYALEPHQIQGLDTVKIFPVVQWLVKRAMETRESLNDHLNSIANLRFGKTFPTESKSGPKGDIPQQFTAERKFKKSATFSQTLTPDQQVVATLMEYGCTNIQFPDSSDSSLQVEATCETKIEKKLENRAIAQRVSSLIHQQSGLISQAIQGYVERQMEREGVKDELTQLKIEHETMTESLNRVSRLIASQEEVMCQLKSKLTELITAKNQLAERRKSLCAFETEENRQILNQLEKLIGENEALNVQRKQFKSQCKEELEHLHSRREGLQTVKPIMGDEKRIQERLKNVREQLSAAQKTLGEKNLAVSRLRRQLDSIPGNAELNQYQRRFTELCSHVNEKQTELNGYYLLYNTLEDTKVYLNKELSLLTSIHDGFSQSMVSASGKGEFLQQMEKIVSAVGQNKNKIEKQIELLTDKHRDLGNCLGELAAQEQEYRDTLKSIAYESQRYRQLVAQQQSNENA